MSQFIRSRHRLQAAAVVTALVSVAPLMTPDLAPAGAHGKTARAGYEVLFVRHAHSNSGPFALDLPLSDLGVSEAGTLAAELHDAPVDAVHTSMMLRAFQTGAAVATDHQLPIDADARINEVSFDLSGIPADDRPALVARLGDIMGRWIRGEDRDEGFGAESFNDVKSRWDDWWTDFVAEHRNDKGTGVVVAHSALLTLMLPATCSNMIDPAFVLAHPIANTMIIKARLHPNGTLTCSSWGGAPIPSASDAPSRNAGRRPSSPAEEASVA